MSVTKIDDLGYKVELFYKIDSKTVVITNLSYYIMMEHSGAVMATSEEYKPIDQTSIDGTQFVGIYDREGAVATGYFNNLEVTITTEDLPYDQFLTFIETTTIK